MDSRQMPNDVNPSGSKRILVIEDDRDYQALLAAVIGGSGEPLLVAAAFSLEEGLLAAHHAPPDLILADLNLPDCSGYQTFLRLRNEVPAAPVVILTGLDDDHTAIRAVEDGALDYLVKTTVPPNLIMRHILMAFERQKRRASASGAGRPNRGMVLAFIGSKGGVGTSTTALNAAAVLSRFDCPTALLEFPSGPGTAPLYATAPSAGEIDSLLSRPAGTINAGALRHALVEADAGLHLLCCGAASAAIPAIDAARVEALVAAARQACHHVVLDLAPRLDQATVAALKLADQIVLVVDREIASLHCAAAMLERIKTIVAGAHEVRLVVVDRSGSETALSFAELKSRLGTCPFVMLPEAAGDVARSYSARAPLVLLRPDGLLGQAYVALVERLGGSAGRLGTPQGELERLMQRRAETPVITENAYS
jgi:CheY-like chemotaxis protein